jgi:hypothetical protein
MLAWQKAGLHPPCFAAKPQIKTCGLKLAFLNPLISGDGTVLDCLFKMLYGQNAVFKVSGWHGNSYPNRLW